MSNRQRLSVRLAIPFLSLLLILHIGCSTEVSQGPRDKQARLSESDGGQAAAVSETQQQKQQQPAAEAAEAKPKPSEPAKAAPPKSEQAATVPKDQEQEQPVPKEPAAKAVEQPVVVAKIGDYVIKKEELEQKLKAEIYPYGYDPYNDKAKAVDVNEVLLKMIAEKAMVMEAREKGFLQDEGISVVVGRFKNRKLASTVWVLYLQGRRNELEVTDEEIDKQMKANPKLDRKQAQAMLQRQKANRIFEQYYDQLCQKYHLKKESENFLEASKLHDRLLNHPKEPRKQWWILNNQVREELTPEERGIVLATYDGGKVTVKDWFYALLEIAPPSRPKDLNTEKGVENFLDRYLKLPVLVAEAQSLGLDKDKDFLEGLRKREDMSLLGKAMSEKVKDINEPTEAQIVAYFEKNKEKFSTPRTVKIDQIWCADLETADKVKAELDTKDFESVKDEFSLQKEGKPFETNAGREGVFFDDLWKGEPNQIIGPMKGFYGEQIKWRIVKILEKKPAQMKEYSSDMNNSIKWRIIGEKKNKILADYRKELLQKYPYEIYADRIKDIDPLKVQ
jgi:peptidyl-prolyl cis-trans isomerase C